MTNEALSETFSVLRGAPACPSTILDCIMEHVAPMKITTAFMAKKDSDCLGILLAPKIKHIVTYLLSQQKTDLAGFRFATTRELKTAV